MLKLLLDEHISPAVAALLRDRSDSVDTAAEEKFRTRESGYYLREVCFANPQPCAYAVPFTRRRFPPSISSMHHIVSH